MVSRGNVNVALNRLVREGVITGFKTNFDDPGSALGLHVIVTADGVAGKARANAKRIEEVRQQVCAALDHLEAEATVTVQGAD